jgi:hypothetical protein
MSSGAESESDAGGVDGSEKSESYEAMSTSPSEPTEGSGEGELTRRSRAG